MRASCQDEPTLIVTRKFVEAAQKTQKVGNVQANVSSMEGYLGGKATRVDLKGGGALQIRPQRRQCALRRAPVAR
jgi:hypothetical protein